MDVLASEMTDLNSQMPDFSSVKSITVYTGNVVRWCQSARRYPMTPEQEILDCIKAALVEWVSKFNPDQVELKGLAEHVVCNLMQDHERIETKEREDIKLSAKLFICRYEPGIIKEAATRVCLELGVAQLDSIILALPPLPEGKCRSLEELQPPWEELESLIREQKVMSIGVSDLDQKLLEALCLSAQVQPSSCQVNLASCCVIPPELTAWAGENGIQLLTHNDPADILPVELFQEALSASLQDPGISEWVPRWILRYSAIIKHRGVIESKGYVIKAERRAEHL
ncbi:glutamate--cysteine ligase regulatory subunit-like [Pristis pectinata]|uniref:glutamate--cysteine ligase regulatory subunit-like n=1 Tax=Pristis pectinata TaxID=685728 RepID=UPI00223CC96A|nr:glutamate--cysteine ligase regulatory subunit-like [Pristis pectinata]